MKKKTVHNPIYDENLKALRERYPIIAQRIEKAPVNRDYEIRGTGKKRYVNVYCRKQECYFYNQDDPQKDVAAQLALLNLKNTKIAVFLGFGLGYEVQYYAKELASRQGTVRILIIEKDLELFKTALHMFNYVPMMNDTKIRLVVGEPEEDLFPIFCNFFQEKTAVIYLKAMKPIYHISSLKLHKDYYVKAMKVLRESGLYSLTFFGNSPQDSLIGIENILGNIREIVSHPGINMLYDKFVNKPAVVVATGPSLNKNKHLLKGLEEKAVIIAADASLRVLIEMGVKPHMVATLERVVEVIDLLRGFTEEQVGDVYLAACPVVLPEVYEEYPGPRIIVYRNFDHFRWLGVDKGILEIKQSAGNMAFKLAQALGCNPIMLIGQDLAYARDGRTHARGALFGENQDLGPEKQFEVMGNDGTPILTTHTWNQFRKAYEIDIAGYQGQCINCTEGGAYINGTEVMTFQEAIDRYVNDVIHPLDIIKSNIKDISTASIKKDIENVTNIIASTKNDLIKMKDLCQTAVDLIKENESNLQAIIDNSGSSEKDFSIGKMYGEVTGYQDKIMSIQPTLQLFLMHIIQPYHLKFTVDLHELPDIYDDKELLQAQLITRYVQWFSVIHDIIAICLNSLDDAQDKINELLASL